MTERIGEGRSLGELFAGEADVPAGAADLAVMGISADSRALRPGQVFAALSGARADGTRFIPQALAAGASAVLVGSDTIVPDLAIPVVRAADPRRALARAAARVHGAQPATIVAVTGTSGKTSVSVFTRQIWEHAGFAAASLGTIGLVAPNRSTYGSLTTPDPVALHETLAQLASDGVTHLALEASSHGLDQRRLDGIRFSAGAFTNLSRDHLDYHPTIEDYFRAKLRLFDTLLPEGATVIVDADQPESGRVREGAQARGLRVLGVGAEGWTLRLRAISGTPEGARLDIEADGRRHDVMLPLVGRFQVSNALVAAGLAIATGLDTEIALDALRSLEGASGRLERIGTHPSGATVFVDYAHKPAALASVLAALRPHATGRLIVVFGAGGDRDAGKRPLMGEAAAAHADRIIVTDDNPRSEDPGLIRRAILAGARHAEEIPDRRQAIRTAVAELAPGDVLLIAGKGHETGQIVGDSILPFSDQDEARAALEGRAEATA